MFNGEKYREGTPAAQFSTVPTPAMKNGDFSGLVDAQGRLITIYDPATGRDVNGVWTRDPFPGNSIPADRINPTAKKLLQYFPDPNCTTPGVARLAEEPLLQRALQQGRVLELGRQGRPQLQQQRPRVLPLGQERAQRSAEHHRHPHAARRRMASCR